MTMGLASDSEEPLYDTLLADQSLLLLFVLTSHCTHEELHNPYTEALFSCTSSQG